jgi:hypothetical protein
MLCACDAFSCASPENAMWRQKVTTPLWSDLDSLIGLSRYDGVDIRPTLLRVLTDMYVLKPVHSAEEEQHYIELALRLIDRVDIATRKAVADRLIRYPAAPLAVIRHLARDIVQFATLDLQQARDQAREPASQQTAGLQGPPSRIAEDVIARLRAPSHASTAAEPAIEQRNSAEPRLGEVFYAADAAERRLILLNLEFSTLPVSRLTSHLPASATLARLEAAALGGRPDIFTRELELALALARADAERIVNDTSGEPMAVAGKAMGMPTDMFQRIVLFVNPAIGRSIERVYALSALYDELTNEAALRLLAILREPPRAAPARSARHQAVLWDDERQSARDAASAAPRRLAAPASERERLANSRQRTT